MPLSPFLLPVLTLVAWTLVVWFWMYATRIPAMSKAKVELDPNKTGDEMMAGIPPTVRWKADNYNHLLEQPTVFYATALALAMAGVGEGFGWYCSWAYVGLRIVHTLIQVTVNNIMARFGVFTLSTFALIGMVVAGFGAVL